jgi:hypothetical protein
MNYTYLDIYDRLNPFTDDNSQRLADYLAGGLNYAYARKDPDRPIVVATRSYDDVSFDLSCLPLLKVYRTTESARFSNITDTNLAITYAMGMPDPDKLPGQLHWVARILVAQINQLSTNDRSCGWWLNPERETIPIEYRIMANPQLQPVYTYVKISVKAREIC